MQGTSKLLHCLPLPRLLHSSIRYDPVFFSWELELAGLRSSNVWRYRSEKNVIFFAKFFKFFFFFLRNWRMVKVVICLDFVTCLLWGLTIWFWKRYEVLNVQKWQADPGIKRLYTGHTRGKWTQSNSVLCLWLKIEADSVINGLVGRDREFLSMIDDETKGLPQSSRNFVQLRLDASRHLDRGFAFIKERNIQCSLNSWEPVARRFNLSDLSFFSVFLANFPFFLSG